MCAIKIIYVVWYKNHILQFTISIEVKWKDFCYCHKFWSDSYHCGVGGGGGWGGGDNGEKDAVNHSWVVIDEVFFSIITIVTINLSLWSVGCGCKVSHMCVTSNIHFTLVGCDIFTVVVMKNPVFLGVTPCCFVSNYQHFSATVLFDCWLVITA